MIKRIPVMECLILLFCFVALAHGNQTALYDKLFANYRPEVRPICGEDKPVDVQIGLAIRQVIDMDEPNQILISNVWMRLNWFDCQLQWNASEYDDIDYLVLPIDNVWTPDITLYDNAAEELPGLDDYRAQVNSDGTVQYNFPTVIHSLCLVDVTSFPFDTQVCKLPFGSWIYHGGQLNVTAVEPEADISNFQVNSEWDLVSVPAERHVVIYDGSPEPYHDVTFYVTLQRKPFFYVMNLLFPCILISMVALMGFLLPPDSGEKIGLEITVLLALAVFMLVVAESLPPTSESFPLVGIYFCLAMAVVTLSTVVSVVIVNVHFRGQLGHSVPAWMRRMFLGKLARLMCVHNEACIYPVEEVITAETMNNADEKKSVTEKLNTSSRSVALKSLELSPLQGVLQKQLSILTKLDNQRMEKERSERMENEWKTVAVVLDRLFLVIFSLLLVSGTISMLIQCTMKAGYLS